MPCPVSDAHFSVSFARGGRLRHEIYIDGGDIESNLAVLRTLREQRAALEEAYGRPLNFEELSGRAACRMPDYAEDGDVSDEQRHPEYIEWFIDSGDRFRRALEAVEVP